MTTLSYMHWWILMRLTEQYIIINTVDEFQTQRNIYKSLPLVIYYWCGQTRFPRKKNYLEVFESLDCCDGQCPKFDIGTRHAMC